MPVSLRRFPATLVVLASLSAGPLAAEPPNPAPDHSLTSDAYIELGLPAPDREWAGRDFEQALAVLKPIAEADPYRLPRYESEKSGSVFRRLASPWRGSFRTSSPTCLPECGPRSRSGCGR